MKKCALCCLALCLVMACLLSACGSREQPREAQTEAQAVEAVAEEKESGRSGLVGAFAGAFLVVYGGMSLLMPERVWSMTRGRARKAAGQEPTKAELNGERVGGVLLLILAAILFFGVLK